MKKNSSRRSFLRKTALISTGIAVYSSTNILNAINIDTCPYDGYNPYVGEKTDLRASSFFGKHLTITGKIFDTTGTFSISNATVEVWHLSPNSEKYKHRSKLKTNSLGEYNFITDFPSKEKGKAARIYFKVSTGKKEYFTELLINDFGAFITDKHWEENNQLGDKLFPKKEGSLNNATITFNITS